MSNAKRQELYTQKINDNLTNDYSTIYSKFINNDDILYNSSKLISFWAMDNILSSMWNLLSNSESPIEKKMLASLLIACKERNLEPCQLNKKQEKISILPKKERKDNELIIYPQKKIGNYRVDIFVEYFVTYYPFDENGEYKALEGRLIIECDGHEFHEKTKEQAKRDKKRDRFLQKKGYTIFHYTGSEIYNDSVKLALECVDFVMNNKVKSNE